MAKRFGFGSGVRSRPCGAGPVQVAARGGADVAGDAALAPAEVVDGGDVGQEVEPVAAEVLAGVDQAGRVDDDRLLPVLVARLDEAGHVVEQGYEATPRIS